MNAAAIAAALGDARRESRAWRCRCPLHRGRSLLISDGWTNPRASSAIQFAWFWRNHDD
jgi:hypothetical protein